MKAKRPLPSCLKANPIQGTWLWDKAKGKLVRVSDRAHIRSKTRWPRNAKGPVRNVALGKTFKNEQEQHDYMKREGFYDA